MMTNINVVFVVKVITVIDPLQMCVSTPQLVKLCSGMIEAGKAYVSANKLFVNGIRDLSQQCKKDEMISVSPSQFTQPLFEPL